MGITTDRNDPELKNTKPNGQHESYLVLSEEERAKGFIRPVRESYQHVGCRPTHPVRDLTPDEVNRFSQFDYVVFEEYPPDSDLTGRYWTKKQLEAGCGAVTKMGIELAETYARDPKFYGATFCCGCKKHFPVEEFVWHIDGTKLGS